MDILWKKFAHAPKSERICSEKGFLRHSPYGQKPRVNGYALEKGRRTPCPNAFLAHAYLKSAGFRSSQTDFLPLRERVSSGILDLILNGYALEYVSQRKKQNPERFCFFISGEFYKGWFY